MLQLPAILKAKEMGLYVGVADFNPKAVGVQYADEYFNASTIDEDALLNASREFRPDGIMTLATDMPMRGVAKVSQELGLHCISYDTAIKATDKYEMIQAFKAQNVSSPWFYTADSLDELSSLKNKLSFPCIMKPTDNAGSHGVVMAHSFDELLLSYEYSRSYSRHGKVILEEYLRGQEVSVEVMVVNSQVHVLQITDKLTTGAPHFVEMGHSQPTCQPVERQNDICNLAIEACKAIGIDQGPAHVEMMLTEHGPVMIELGARMGGDNITTSLVPLSTGIDMVKATIEVALGRTPDIAPSLHCASAIRYISAPTGLIKSIAGIEEAKRIHGVKDILMTKSVGEMSTQIRCSNDRLGSVIAQAATADEAVRICNNALEMIRVVVE